LALWHVPAPAGRDLFLDTTGWGKGVAWCNGWNLGRYWGKGPQQTLYVPGAVVRERNTVVALELLAAADPAARFAPGPKWSTTTADDLPGMRRHHRRRTTKSGGCCPAAPA